MPDVGPELAASPDLASDSDPVDTRDVPAGQGPDTRDVAGPETTFSEVPLETASEAGRDGPDTAGAGACVADLSGSAPFGKALSGTATFSLATAAPITSTFTAYVYFPAGRVAGAPVQLAVQSRVASGQYFFGPQATLASDLSASGLTVGGHDMQITGNLLPGAGGLQATVAANFSSPGTDVADDRSATMLMCPTGDVPAPSLKVGSGILSPLSTLALGSTAPLTQEAINDLRITSPLGAVAFTASLESSSRFSHGPNVSISAASAFPPGQPLTFDASAVKDVLGRDVPLTLAGIQVLTTTAVLSDLTLATAPPAGAIACSGCSASGTPSVDGGATGMSACTGGGAVAGGVLTVSLSRYGGGPNVDALLALPASTGSTKLRVRMAVGDIVEAGSTCQNGYAYASMQTATLAVVGANGEVSARLSLTCDGGLANHVIDLPNASKLWLAVHVEGLVSMPYFSPAPGPPSINIDEMAFE